MATVHWVDDKQEVEIPQSAFSLEGFRNWAKSDDFPETGRICYIDGEVIVDMSPEKIESHGRMKWAISLVIGDLIEDLDLGRFYPDRTLITNVKAGVSNEPDATFISWESLESSKARPVPIEGEEDSLEIEGSPDWVLEVVSTSSVAKDTKKLRKAYHRAGIREYWLVDARGEEIEWAILHHEPKGYVPSTNREGWQESKIFDRWFRLERARDRLGFWKYKLRSKEREGTK